MPIQKTFKITKLSNFNDNNPSIDYDPPNNEFDTLKEARKAKPHNTGQALYIVIELIKNSGGPPKVRLVD